jgi:hypothetical protein
MDRWRLTFFTYVHFWHFTAMHHDSGIWSAYVKRSTLVLFMLATMFYARMAGCFYTLCI